MRLSQPIWTRFLPTRAVLSIATVGPIGRRLPAPGTWGSLVGILYFVVIYRPFGPASAGLDAIENALISAFGLYLAVGICGEAEFRLGRKDPPEVILDEVAAMPLCFLGWPLFMPYLSPALLCLAAFLLFRLLDIAKPFGIRRLQFLPGGWGVVMDDVAAALAACGVLHLGRLAWLWARSR